MNEEPNTKNNEKDKYRLSIITPCHNVNIELFTKSYESMKAQTFGFENIEWVIVIHNSSDENANAIKELVDGHPNVFIYRLDNDKRTPSSPRNYALERATGTYIGFLDADDYFEPDTFEIALRHIAETDSQIVVFRFETESDDPGRQPIRPYVLIDQTKEVIVVERDNWDSRTFIYGAALSIWTKVYNRRFLEENNLKFDEEVPLAEDNLFNLDCYNKARRICFLPQLIGYHYYLNDGSIVQSFAKPADDVMRYARGIAKVFDHGLSYGLYMNNVMWDLLGYQSAIMLASVDLTYEQRKTVSDLLNPYLKMLTKWRFPNCIPQKW